MPWPSYWERQAQHTRARNPDNLKERRSAKENETKNETKKTKKTKRKEQKRKREKETNAQKRKHSEHEAKWTRTEERKGGAYPGKNEAGRDKLKTKPNKPISKTNRKQGKSPQIGLDAQKPAIQVPNTTGKIETPPHGPSPPITVFW